jgi:hypothetical protein
LVRAQEGEQLIIIKPLYCYSVAVFLFLIVRQTNTENVPNSLQN